MHVTTITVLGIYVFLTILTIKKPFYGIIFYELVFFLNPTNQWWGRQLTHSGMRWDFYPALILLVSYVFHTMTSAEERAAQKVRYKGLQTTFLVLLGLLAIIISQFAVVSSEIAWSYTFNKLVKRIIFYLLMIRLVRTEKEYKIFVWVYILGAFWFGWQAFVHPKMVGGRLEGIGGSGTSESSQLGQFMATPVAFLIIYGMKGSKWEKLACIFTAPFILNAFVLTKSRGGFLALIGVCLMIALFSILRGSFKMKAQLAIGLIIGTLLFFKLADEGFMKRMETIETRDDGASTGRIMLWKAALLMMQDHPFGVGTDNFQLLSGEYTERLGYRDEGMNVHNTYLLVGAEQGFIGLFLFLCILFFTFRDFFRLSIGRLRFDNNKKISLQIEAISVGSALFGLCVGIFFLTSLYVEPLYWLIGLSVVLINLKKNELENENLNVPQNINEITLKNRKDNLHGKLSEMERSNILQQ